VARRGSDVFHHRHPAAGRWRPHRLNILSIQSRVVYGHVGNAASAFALQRLGAEVWTIDTVQFSNHTGYGDWEGRALTGAEVSALVDGIDRRGALGRCDAVLSGYLGGADIGDAVLDAVERVRAARPRALYACDPVIGDGGRVYVRAGIPELLRDRALPAADIATPNAFELSFLTGHALDGGTAMVLSAIGALRGLMRPDGPRAVLLTSLRAEDDAIDLVAADDEGAVRVRTPHLPINPNGAGDLIAAVFLFHFAASGRASVAVEAAASAVWGILAATVAAGSTELELIPAQNELVAPRRRFFAEPIR
jgi:pyridoxine kinase